MSPKPAFAMPSSRRPIVVAVLALACVFVVSSSVRLDGQGLHGDELHQANAVFAFGPNRPEIVDGLSIGGIPVLNMPYSGAIKSAAFAAYLQLPGSAFNAVTWRLFGILLSAAGIVGFGLIAGRWIRMVALVPFLLLVITDGTVLLASRHDWGPVALALLLRFIVLALWVRGECQETTSPTNSLLIGLVVGIAVFEKLSNVALVAILPLLFGLSPTRRTMRHAIALVTGLALGTLPVAAVNVYTYFRDGTLISLAPEVTRNYSTQRELADYLEAYLGLGVGDEVRSYILGSGAAAWQMSAEFFITLALLLMTAAGALLWGRRNDLLRMSGVLLSCYVVIALAIYALPRATWVHHWIIGTPFQYLAFALAGAGLLQIWKQAAVPLHRVWAGCFLALTVGLLVSRSLSFVSLERSLFEGQASQWWHPSLTRFGELMSEHVDGGVVIAAGWGLAPVAYCLSGGPPNFAHPLFWDYQRTSDITNRLDALQSRVMFVAKPEWWSVASRARGRQLWRDLDSIGNWAPDWREVPLTDELRELEWISVRKFVRASTP